MGDGRAFELLVVSFAGAWGGGFWVHRVFLSTHTLIYQRCPPNRGKGNIPTEITLRYRFVHIVLSIIFALLCDRFTWITTPRRRCGRRRWRQCCRFGGRTTAIRRAFTVSGARRGRRWMMRGGDWRNCWA